MKYHTLKPTLVNHKIIDTPKLNILILNVSTLSLSDLQKKTTFGLDQLDFAALLVQRWLGPGFESVVKSILWVRFSLSSCLHKYKTYYKLFDNDSIARVS